MPMYDYKCKSCNEIFTRLIKYSEDNDKPLTEPCPKCNESGNIVKSYSVAGISAGMLKVDGGWKEVISKIKADHPKGYYGSLV